MNRFAKKLKHTLKPKTFLKAILALMLLGRGPVLGQCELTISPSAPDPGCLYAVENVVWTDLVNNTADANTLQKVSGGNSWNGGAASTNAVDSFGYLEFIVTETNTARMIGLSNVNTNADYTTIEFSIYLRTNAQFEVRESGSNRGNFGSYSVSDTFRIYTNGTEVTYYQNGDLVYRSSVSPSMPLIGDVSIYTVNGTVGATTIANGTDGNLSATTSSGAGTGPVYQWQLNGANVGANSPNYSNTFSDGDSIRCILTPGASGCGVGNDTSNYIVIREITSLNLFSDLYLSPVNQNPSCILSNAPVTWTDFVNTSYKNDTIRKIQSGGSWNGGAASYDSVFNNGYFEFLVNETNTARMIGLSSTNTDANYTTIQFAIYLRGDGTFEIRESGTNRGNMGAYASGDTMRIAIEENDIKYYQNSSLVYISGVNPAPPLISDISINTLGGTVVNARIFNGTGGAFNAIGTNIGSNPSYQWYLNGGMVGSNSPTYTNATLVNGDNLRCEVTPDLGGCTGISYSSRTTVIQTETNTNLDTFFVFNQASSSACQYATEPISWTSLVNLDATGNNLEKIQNGGSWNGGAASLNTVSQNGFLEFSTSESNTAKMIGLSSTNTDANYTSIEFAIYLRTDGTMEVRESGTNRGNMGAYAANDTFRVAVEEGVVRYYKNDTLLYISGVSPSLPLIADASLYTLGATVTDAVIINGNTGNFTAYAIGAGSNPSYQWYLNGVAVGTNDSTYTNTTLSSGDSVYCEITPDLSGCVAVSYTSLPVFISDIPTPTFGDFFTFNEASSSACQYATELVTWTDLLNNEAMGNNLEKIQNGGSWNGGAASLNTVSQNGFLEFSTSENNTAKMIGLSSTNTDADYTTIRFAIYLRTDGTMEVRESGTNRGNMGAYAANDTFRVAVEEGVVKYYRNGDLLYISGGSPSLPLIADASLYTLGATVTNAVIINGNTGNFTTRAKNAGSNPTYQWFLNGAPVGINDSTYTNTSLSAGDTVTCTVTPDLGGCGVANSYTTLPVIISDIPTPTFGDFFTFNEASSSACQYATELVTWTDLLNNEAMGNNLEKIQNGGSWNGGAASLNTVSQNGFLEFSTSESNTAKMIGLSSTNTDANYTSIEFAIYLRTDGTMEVRESGTNRGNMGAYAANDTFRVAVEEGVVRYYKNDTLLYISGVSPSLPLIADASLYTLGATVTDAVIINGNTGNFTTLATNAGSNPTYQWFLNGAPVGINDSTYTNTSLSAGDTVTCTVTPDLGGCGVANSYTTLPVIISDIPTPTFGDFFTFNEASSSACQYATELVTWTDLLNNEAMGNNLEKIQNGGSWNGGAASLNTVSQNGFLEFSTSENNTAKMIGLSSTNTDADYTTIRFAIYLRTDGTMEVRESGTNRGNMGAYAANDTFRVAVEEGVVKYYRNGDLLYISGGSPSLPLIADASLYTLGATVTNAVIINGNTGNFTTRAKNAGSNPTYQWFLNGAPVGINDSTYTNTSLSAGDTVTCTVTPDLGGCGVANSYTTLPVIISDIPTPTFGDFFTFNEASSSACQYATELVTWTDLLNNEAMGNNLEKIQNGGSWNGGAASLNTVSQNGFLEFSTSESNTAKMIGLSSTNTDANYTSIEFAIYLRTDGTMEVRESGTNRGNMGAYAANDTFRVAVEEGVVKYYRNGDLLYISGGSPSLPLIADASLYTLGATVTDAVIINGNTGNFTTLATNAGSNPTYQWFLNGAPVGINDSTYTNTSLSAGDTVTCTVTPDLGGCGVANSYTTLPVIISDIPTPTFGDFFTFNEASSSACQYATELVTWTDLLNNEAMGNNLEKIQNGGSWNGGAASLNTVSQNGFLEFSTSESNTAKMIGLSSSNTNSNFNTIQFAIYLRTDSTMEVRESGNNRGNMGRYLANDTFKVAVEDGEVRYYKNDTLLYISAVSPSLPLIVDVSLYTLGSTVKDARISNGNTGNFTTRAKNAGSNPTFQWFLNGLAVGTNDSTYTNASLSPGDAITCTVTPDLGGCGVANSYTTLPVILSDYEELLFGEIVNSNQPDPPGDLNAVEEAAFTDLVNLEVEGNNLQKIQSGGSWNGGGATLNTIENEGLIQTIVSETNTARYFGISSSNSSSNNSSIDFAIYLRSDATMEIRESGSNRGNVGAYVSGDTLKVAIVNNQVVYYRNQTLLYTSALSPAATMIGDFSINTLGGTLNDISVVHYASGTFTLTALNMGANPTFQWRLNGGNVGTNDTFYVNTGVNVGDVITCIVTPDLGGGCSSSNAFVSNPVYITGLTAPLPIDLLRFDHRVVDGRVYFEWETESEIRFKQFKLQRSRDGIGFETIETIMAEGNEFEGSVYQAVDQNPYSGIAYYRLLLEDLDGSVGYSDLKIVEINLADAEISIFPNPNTGEFYIGFAGGLNISEIEVYDPRGRKVHFMEARDPNGIRVKITGSDTGLFIVKIKTESDQYLRKVLIVD